LWKLKRPPVIGPVAATTLTAIIVAGGVIDFFPIRNSSYVEAGNLIWRGDPLVAWLSNNTKPKDILLTDRFASHPVFLSGRKIFFGSPDLTRGAGYDVAKREPIYRQMFESKNPQQVFHLLKENRIDYVVFDDGLRHGQLIKNANEKVYLRNFKKGWENNKNRYGKLVIYKVPESLPAGVAKMDVSEPPITAFE